MIDLLVVYPSFVRHSAGGHLAMRALIDSDVTMANEAYRVGGATQRLNLVAAVEARRTPLERRNEDMIDAFRHVTNPSSGYMDEVPPLRNAYAADLVLVHWGDLLYGGTSGLADPLDSLSQEGARFGFSVSNSRAFAHELGHNMGLNHPRRETEYKSNRPFPYSYGYIHDNYPKVTKVRNFGTIMSTRPSVLPRFSNPRQRHPDESGVPMGVPGDEPSQSDDGPADAVRSLNGTRRVVANFRRSASCCGYELLSPSKELPAYGGEFRIGVTAGAGCAWSAWSNDDFVSVADGASGAGDREVVFRVSANGGWEREVSVFVAGEAYLAEQATARERRVPPPVCERVPAVRDAITAAAGKEACGEVTFEGLAAIRVLDLPAFDWQLDSSEKRLGPGAFDGLTGLVSLDLSWMGLTDLAPGTFDGLTRLVSLDLRHNVFTTLASGVFDGVPNLVSLQLNDNPRLTTLEPGAFRGLSYVEELDFRRTGLTSLSAGAFDGLSNLFRLEFEVAAGYLNGEYFDVKVPLARVEPGAFRGLSKLDRLYFESNSLTELELGVFDGLPNLRRLKVGGNEGLAALQPGLFGGLSKLRKLVLHGNGLTTLPPGLFDGLAELEILVLWNNKLKVLESEVFRGLAALTQLHLDRNQLQTLKPRLFDGLSQLRTLGLSDNKLATVHPSLLRELDSLENLALSRNPLATLDPDLFDGQLDQQGRSQMFSLHLSGVGLERLDPDLLRGMVRLKHLFLDDNHFNKLPFRLFDGLYGLRRLDLSGNPGAPFAFRPEFVRLSGGVSGSDRAVRVALAVSQGAAFDLRVGLSASGGTLSAPEALVRIGQTEGEAVTVRPNGAGPVVLRMTDVSDVPGPTCIEMSLSADDMPCLKGVRTALGAPLVLFGLPNQALGPDGTVRLDLPSAFPNLAEGMTFAVELGDPAVAEAVVAKGLLTLAAVEGGVTPVTVTATDPDGLSAALTFTVTVEQSIRSLWGGWRSVLLQSSSSQNDDGPERANARSRAQAHAADEARAA